MDIGPIRNEADYDVALESIEAAMAVGCVRSGLDDRTRDGGAQLSSEGLRRLDRVAAACIGSTQSL